jgi:uncharacterized RDD family membrane protein YckC
MLRIHYENLFSELNPFYMGKNMNTEEHSFSNQSTQLEVNLDDFNISEDSFKPMTKGLGFHHEQKRPAFKATPKEVKPFGANPKTQPKTSSLLKPMSEKNEATASAQAPTGLEAFYGTKGSAGPQTNMLDKKMEDLSDKLVETKQQYKTAASTVQLFAWIIDVLVVASFVAVTGALLVFASGIQFEMFSRLISKQDLIAFSAAIFSIYYLLYFTILDLSASPGKTIMGVRLLKTDNKNVSVKNTFTRALVSLLSVVALFLPMLLDFQGRLSDTKVVK